MDGVFDVRSIAFGGSLLVCLGCVSQRDLSSYSEGAAAEERVALEPAPEEQGATPEVPSEDPPAEAPPADEAADTAPMVTAAVDEAVPEGAPLDPAPMNAGASAPAETEPGSPGEETPSEEAPGEATPVTPPTPVDPAEACPTLGGFTLADTDSCYMVGDNVFSWEDARSFCQAWGGDLVEIGSFAENLALAGRIETNVWIGANDQDEEGTFRWASGAPLDYTRWSQGQPNDALGNEDCSELIASASWFDVPCSGNVPRRALCELSAAAADGAI